VAVDLSPLRKLLRESAKDCPREALPELVAELARAQAVATLRLFENGRTTKRPAPDIRPAGRLIDANAAAEILDTKVRWLYDRADELPFTRRLGPRTLRFDEAALRRWLETRK
jgi:predicted DNA-binding transcriptional regulator AlpA